MVAIRWSIFQVVTSHIGDSPNIGSVAAADHRLTQEILSLSLIQSGAQSVSAQEALPPWQPEHG